MSRRRLVATVVAIVLVVGAFIVRQNVLDDDDDGDESNEQLYCITELADVCTALETDFAVTVEHAGVTLDRIAALEQGEPPPLWLTIEPYPAMVDVMRGLANDDALQYESTIVAASRLAVVVPTGRDAVLSELCADQRLWRCLGDHAGEPWSDLDGEPRWGDLLPAFGVVEQSGLALGSLAAAVAGYFDTDELTASSWSDTDFRFWLGDLADVGPSDTSYGDDTAFDLMRTRSSAVNAAATASFEVTSVDAAGDRYALIYPEPEMWLQVVLAAPGDGAPGDLTSDTAAALTNAGWEEPAAAVAPLPNASIMVALRQLWGEVS